MSERRQWKKRPRPFLTVTSWRSFFTSTRSKRGAEYAERTVHCASNTVLPMPRTRNGGQSLKMDRYIKIRFVFPPFVRLILY